MSKSTTIKKNEWINIFSFTLINIVGAALVMNVLSTSIMLSVGAFDQVSPIYRAALPITFILAIGYSLFVGSKAQKLFRQHTSKNN